MRKMTQTERIRRRNVFFFLIIVGNCYLSIADRLERNNAKDHVRRPCLLKRSEG